MQHKLLKIFLWIVFTTVILLGIALFAVPRLLISPMVNTHIDFMNIHEAETYGLTSTVLTLTSDDGLSLEAYAVDAETPRGVIIFLSGIHNPSVTAFYGHAKMVYDIGFSSILLDVRAKGNSEGDAIGLAYHEVMDVESVINYIQSEPKYEDIPIIVYGLSMGGSLAINAMGQYDAIDAAISLSAYSSFTDVFMDNMKAMGFPNFYLALQRPFVNQYIHSHVGKDLKHMIPKTQIQHIGERPMLLMHALRDDQVPYASFERIVENAPSHIETYTIDTASHFILEGDMFLRPYEDLDYYDIIIAFLNRHF